MKAILNKEKCWEAVDEVYAEGTTDAEKKSMVLLAHSEIMLRLSNDVAQHVLDFDTAKNLWHGLKDLYQVKTLPSKINLLCRLFNFKMDINLSLQDNLDKFLRIMQDLDRCCDKDKVVDSHQTVILLNSLPSQFENFKDIIQFRGEELTKKAIIEAITQKNKTMKVFKSKIDKYTKSEVLFTKGKGKGKNKHVPNKNNKTDEKPHNNANNNGAGSSQVDKKNAKCHYCGKKCNVRF